MAEQTSSDSPAVANATAVTYPLEIEIPLTLKISVANSELHEYYLNAGTKTSSTYFLADLFDSLDTGFEDVVSLNGKTRVDIQKLLHEANGAVV